MNGGALQPMFGWLVGTGPGSGMSLMFVLFGTIGALVGLGGYLFPAVRHAEDLLPDHEMGGETAVSSPPQPPPENLTEDEQLMSASAK